jgi:hypothetical protein
VLRYDKNHKNQSAVKLFVFLFQVNFANASRVFNRVRGCIFHIVDVILVSIYEHLVTCSF